MRKALLASCLVAAASLVGVASPANASPPTGEFEFLKNFVKSVERDAATVRFRCPKGDTALVGAYVSLSPRDPAYDPDIRVYASMDYYANAPCTGKPQTLTLDLGSVSRHADDETDGGYPKPGQLVGVTAYTDILPSGEIVTANSKDVRVRATRP